jgi:hypothetical protein
MQKNNKLFSAEMTMMLVEFPTHRNSNEIELKSLALFMKKSDPQKKSLEPQTKKFT